MEDAKTIYREILMESKASDDYEDLAIKAMIRYTEQVLDEILNKSDTKWTVRDKVIEVKQQLR